MKKSSARLVRAFYCGVFLVLVLYDVAEAYIDPGTGSFMLQVVLAGLVGVGFAVKMFWQNIRMFLSRVFLRRGQKEQE